MKNLQNHIDSLKKKHTILQNELDQEQKKPAPDNIKITKIKKDKLTLKQEIEEAEIELLKK